MMDAAYFFIMPEVHDELSAPGGVLRICLLVKMNQLRMWDMLSAATQPQPPCDRPKYRAEIAVARQSQTGHTLYDRARARDFTL